MVLKWNKNESVKDPMKLGNKPWTKINPKKTREISSVDKYPDVTENVHIVMLKHQVKHHIIAFEVST